MGSPEYDYKLFGLQAGHYLYRSEDDKGRRNYIGVSLAYGHAKGTSTHVDGAKESNRFDAFSLSGYWTHFDEKGWYIDGML